MKTDSIRPQILTINAVPQERATKPYIPPVNAGSLLTARLHDVSDASNVEDIAAVDRLISLISKKIFYKKASEEAKTIITENPKILHCPSSHGETLLNCALKNKKVDIAHLMLDLKVPLDFADVNGEMPLEIAIKNDLPELAEKMVKAEAPLHVRDHAGKLPLSLAIEGRHPDLAKKIVIAGSPYSFQAQDSSSVPEELVAAASGAYSDLVELIKDRSGFKGSVDDLTTKSSSIQSALEVAMQDPILNDDVIKLLLEHGADPNIEFSDGRYALEVAMENPILNDDVIKLLLEHKADPNVEFSDGRYALEVAMENPILNDDVIKLLLEHKADPNIEFSDGRYALEVAMQDPILNEDVIRILLSHGAQL